MKITKLLFLSLLVFQVGHVDGMESPIIPMDLMPDIIKYVTSKGISWWYSNPLQQAREDQKCARNRMIKYRELSLVSKDFKRMFWNCFTLREKDSVIYPILRKKKYNHVDIAVGMGASLYPILYRSLSHSDCNLESVRAIINMQDVKVINKMSKHMDLTLTVLHIAIQQRRFDIAELLLNCPVTNVNETVPLYTVVQNKDIKMIKLFLAHPQIQIDTVNELGETALFAIADNKWTDETDRLRSIIDLLLEAGVDSSIKNNNAMTALDVVREEWSDDKIKVLEVALAAKKNNL